MSEKPTGEVEEPKPAPAIELGLPALTAEVLDEDDDAILPESDEEAYEHVEKPEGQILRNGMPLGEEVSIVSDDETHHYAIAKWRGLELRERIPLHVFKQLQTEPVKALQAFNEISRRLRAKLCKKVGGAPPDVRSERDRRRRGRQIARREAEQMLKERLQGLIKRAEAASQPAEAFESLEKWSKAVGLREAAGVMLGREPLPLPRPSRFFAEGATVIDIAKELGLTAETPGPAVLPAAGGAGAEPTAATDATPPLEPPPAAPAEVFQAPKAKAKGKARAKSKKAGKAAKKPRATKK